MSWSLEFIPINAQIWASLSVAPSCSNCSRFFFHPLPNKYIQGGGQKNLWTDNRKMGLEHLLLFYLDSDWYCCCGKNATFENQHDQESFVSFDLKTYSWWPHPDRKLEEPRSFLSHWLLSLHFICANLFPLFGVKAVRMAIQRTVLWWSGLRRIRSWPGGSLSQQRRRHWHDSKRFDTRQAQFLEACQLPVSTCWKS